MRTVITGATGYVGRACCELLCRHGDDVVAVTRNTTRAASVLGHGVRCVSWGGGTGGEWEREIDGADAVIHLAGESIGAGRWTDAVKAQLRESRIVTTRALVDSIAHAAHKPRCFVCASAVGVYGDRGDALLTEESGAGTGFLAELCQDWEREAERAAASGIREVRLRLGVVLGPRGGALARMLYPLPVHLSPWKLGLGGRLGSGRQWVSWISLTDAAAMFVWAAREERAMGAINATAPEPVTNATLTNRLSRALGRPALMPVPQAALRLILGEFADTILGGQRALPSAAKRLGFTYALPELEAALGVALSA